MTIRSELVYVRRVQRFGGFCRDWTWRIRIKVLYIAGSGRSGTTIISRLLGEFPGFVNVGEAVRHFFDDNERARTVPCGCGQPVSECEFWRDIAGSISTETQASGAELLRLRRFPKLFLRSAHPGVPTEYCDTATAISSMYERVLRKAGGEVIVDASKSPMRGLLVSLLPDVELHVLHVVRDPQKVTESWNRKKGFLATHPPWKVAVRWWPENLFSGALRFRANTYRLLRYEDFVSSPGPLLQEIAADVAGTPLLTPFLSGRRATFRVQHLLGGNPDKFDSLEVQIEERDGQSEPRRVLVDLLTFPLQLRYDYLPLRR